MIDTGLPPGGLSQFAGPLGFTVNGPTTGTTQLIPSRGNRSHLILGMNTSSGNFKPGGYGGTSLATFMLSTTFGPLTLDWNTYGPLVTSDWWVNVPGAGIAIAIEWWYVGNQANMQVLSSAGLIRDGRLAALLAKLNPFKRQ